MHYHSARTEMQSRPPRISLVGVLSEALVLVVVALILALVV